MNLEYLLPDYVTEEMLFIVLGRIYGMPINIDELNVNFELNNSEINLLKIKDDTSDNRENIINGVDVTNQSLVLDSNLLNSAAVIMHFCFIQLEDLYGNGLANFYLSYKKKVGNSYFKIEENIGLVLESESKIALIGMCGLLDFFGGVLKIKTIGGNQEDIINNFDLLYQPHKNFSKREKKIEFIRALKKISILNKESLKKHIKYLDGVNIDRLIEMQMYREKELISNNIEYKEKENKKVLKF